MRDQENLKMINIMRMMNPWNDILEIKNIFNI